MMRSINREGLDIITGSEGCRLRAYRCPSGIWTIGFGDTENVRPGMAITRAEAVERLKHRLTHDFEPGVERHAKVRLSGNQFSALVSLAYNIGVGRLSRSDLLRKLNAGDAAGAAGEFGHYIRSATTGEVLPGLVTRRAAERKLFLTPGDGTPA